MLNVPHRESILIYVGNSALDDLPGCIAPVTKHTGPGEGIYGRIALERLKTLVYPAPEGEEEV